jgi:cysteine desulfurases, SufS subfamily
LKNYRADFPIFGEDIENGLIYFDSAATTQKPQAVIAAISNYYREYNANPHRGSYQISIRATEAMEKTREQVKSFLHVDNKEGEIIFTKSATESLNLVAYSYGMPFVNAGDEILISVQEHNSNLVLWQNVAKVKGAVLKYFYIKQDGSIDYDDFLSKITDRTKIVAVTHVSNVLGFVNPIKDIIKVSKAAGAVTVIDGTQAVPHMKVDLQSFEPDFYVFSGHKLLAPMGVGVLYGRRKLLDKMPPFLYGGDMVEYVEEQETTYAQIPAKYEGGTQNVEAIVGLGAAISYLNEIGMERVHEIEQELVSYALEKMAKVPGMHIYGEKNMLRIGVIPFNLEGVHPHDVASILDNDNICIRAGNHCASALITKMGEHAICRASFYLYNTREEIDFFVEKLTKVRRWFGYES